MSRHYFFFTWKHVCRWTFLWNLSSITFTDSSLYIVYSRIGLWETQVLILYLYFLIPLRFEISWDSFSDLCQRCHMAFFRAILDKCGYFWKSFSRKKMFGYKLNLWLFCGYFSKLLFLVAIWLFCGYFKPFLLLFQSICLFFSNIYLFLN